MSDLTLRQEIRLRCLEAAVELGDHTDLNRLSPPEKVESVKNLAEHLEKWVHEATGIAMPDG